MNIEKRRIAAAFVRETRVQIYERLMDAELAFDNSKPGPALLFIAAASDLIGSLAAQLGELVVDNQAGIPRKEAATATEKT